MNTLQYIAGWSLTLVGIMWLAGFVTVLLWIWNNSTNLGDNRLRGAEMWREARRWFFGSVLVTAALLALIGLIMLGINWTMVAGLPR